MNRLQQLKSDIDAVRELRTLADTYENVGLSPDEYAKYELYASEDVVGKLVAHYDELIELFGVLMIKLGATAIALDSTNEVLTEWKRIGDELLDADKSGKVELPAHLIISLMSYAFITKELGYITKLRDEALQLIQEIGRDLDTEERHA